MCVCKTSLYNAEILRAFESLLIFDFTQANFARTGDPNVDPSRGDISSLPHWQRYNAANKSTLMLRVSNLSACGSSFRGKYG